MNPHAGPEDLAHRVSEDKTARLEIEEYDCGCKVRFRLVDYGEAGEEVPRTPVVVPDYTPCARHRNNTDIPPRGSRLVTLRKEHENFLNE